MWALLLYGQVCSDWRQGRGEHPDVVFGRLAREVLTKEAERTAREAASGERAGPVLS